MGILIDGKKISAEIKKEIKQKVFEITESGGRPPCLAAVIAGDDGASGVYVASMEKACLGAGMRPLVHRLSAGIGERELLELVAGLNADGGVDGILIQVPLPKHVDEEKVLLAIDPKKDMDGFHPYNMGLLTQGVPKLPPCTPAGIIELIKRSGIAFEGKSCVVIGRSNIVGKPVALLLLRENATVTVCHSRTKDLAEVCRGADILVAAVGKPKFVVADMIKEGAVVIDVGVHRLRDGRLCGDVDFEACEPKAAYITPVPGGVGPMTIAMLLRNCLNAYEGNPIK